MYAVLHNLHLDRSVTLEPASWDFCNPTSHSPILIERKYYEILLGKWKKILTTLKSFTEGSSETWGISWTVCRLQEGWWRWAAQCSIHQYLDKENVRRERSPEPGYFILFLTSSADLALGMERMAPVAKRNTKYKKLSNWLEWPETKMICQKVAIDIMEEEFNVFKKEAVKILRLRCQSGLCTLMFHLLDQVA